MSIETAHYVKCDGCGQPSGVAESGEAALELAKSEGFQIKGIAAAPPANITHWCLLCRNN